MSDDDMTAAEAMREMGLHRVGQGGPLHPSTWGVNRPVDLADFLLARIAEDEAVAKEASHLAPSGPDPAYVSLVDPLRVMQQRFDPPRVLAECEAKRLIVEAEPERWVLQPDAPGSTVDMGCPDGMVRVYGKLITELEYRDRYMELAPPSQTLLYLALPYAEHPSYDESWRP